MPVDPCACGNFVRGVPASGDCFTDCCPHVCPPPCCDAVYVNFYCGTNIDQNPALVGACNCSYTTPFWFGNGNKPPPPKFNLNPIHEDPEFVFALAGACSVPCASVTVTVTTSGCCLELIADSNLLYAVGGGIVSASASPSSLGDCGTLTPQVNGSNFSAAVADGDNVIITVQPADSDCCQCCTNGFATCTAPMWVKRTRNGKPELHLNQKYVIDGLNRMRIARIRNRMRKLRGREK